MYPSSTPTQLETGMIEGKLTPTICIIKANFAGLTFTFRNVGFNVAPTINIQL